MRVHVIGDSLAKLATLRTLLERHYPVTSELISDAGIRGDGAVGAVLVAADLRSVDNITAIKQIGKRMNRIAKRIFIVDQKSRLSTVQAYALGATAVLTNPVGRLQLMAKLTDKKILDASLGETPPDIQEAAAIGAACIASMFSSALHQKSVDLKGLKGSGRKIADGIADAGLSHWLANVRQHHEGTYQHCLLVTGIAVDFGLSLGLSRTDLERLYLAAMLHDIGKAKIPLAILDKPGRLEADERTLVETHPAVGYEALKGTDGVTPELLDAVLHHHEFLDGSGYPDALCSESIPDLVRILTISDIFAALIEHRNYKPTMPRPQAYQTIQSMNGKLEKPLVMAFREVALTR
jgi:putative nucleotidyltransferase with HDIG domain